MTTKTPHPNVEIVSCPSCGLQWDKLTEQHACIESFGECIVCRFMPSGRGTHSGTSDELSTIQRKQREMLRCQNVNMTPEMKPTNQKHRGIARLEVDRRITRDDIIRMARDAGVHLGADDGKTALFWYPEIERFAELVADAARKEEREQCAQICDDEKYFGYVPPEDMNAEYYYNEAASSCAASIRARSKHDTKRTD